jgi:hypothetical protein
MADRVRSVLHRDVAARFPIRTRTQDKLQEASYFRHRLKDTAGNRDEFRWNLTAFISAARSVTLIMQTEYTHRDGFLAWYEPKRQELIADSLMGFLHDKRNEVLHKTVVQVYGRPESEVVRAPDAEEDAPAVEDDVLAIEVTEADAKHEVAAPRPGKAARPQPPAASKFVWTFRKFPDRDVMDVVEEALTKLERLVKECTQRFG